MGPTKDTSTNTCGASTCSEANLDVQYLTAISSITPTYYSYYPDVSGYLDYNAWLNTIEVMADPPYVISISYGATTDYSKYYAFQFDNLAVLLAAKGVTLIAGSGDTGTNGYKSTFPSTSQYVISVGATQGPESNLPEIVCSTKTGASIDSGGGFSISENAPDWQIPFISSYFNSLPPSKVPVAGYNTNGRGYPDVSLLGHAYIFVNDLQFYSVDGTSASTPVFAAMVALVNAARLAAGLPPLGWINPSLYKNYKSIILNDIISGDNLCSPNGCGTQGFYASPGWYHSCYNE